MTSEREGGVARPGRDIQDQPIPLRTGQLHDPGQNLGIGMCSAGRVTRHPLPEDPFRLLFGCLHRPPSFLPTQISRCRLVCDASGLRACGARSKWLPSARRCQSRAKRSHLRRVVPLFQSQQPLASARKPPPSGANESLSCGKASLLRAPSSRRKRPVNPSSL